VHPPELPRPETGPAHDSLIAAINRPVFSPQNIETSSRMPGGGIIHRAAGKAVSRQTAGVLLQVQQWRDEVQSTLHDSLTAIEAYAGHTHADLRNSLAGALDRIVIIDRLEAMVRDIDRRLVALEARLDGRPPE
jgi:hypothetical protein